MYCYRYLIICAVGIFDIVIAAVEVMAVSGSTSLLALAPFSSKSSIISEFFVILA
ncbi:hypothetical protein N9R48_02910 [Rickettsiales bacterium]|nr:hypothetical protein [Rickettsiales bacterium]